MSFANARALSVCSGDSRQSNPKWMDVCTDTQVQTCIGTWLHHIHPSDCTMKWPVCLCEGEKTRQRGTGAQPRDVRDRTLAPCLVACSVLNSLCEVSLNRTVQRRERTHCQALLSAPPSTSSPPPLEGQANPLSSQGVGYTHAHFKTHTRGKTRRGDETTTRLSEEHFSTLPARWPRKV